VIFLAEEHKKEVLPFPTAPIVRVMRKKLDAHKLIRRQVKDEMNKWLARMCERVSEKMNESPYPTVDYPLFKQAIQPYENIEEFEKEKERIVANLEKIKQDCDALLRDLNRKFKV